MNFEKEQDKSSNYDVEPPKYSKTLSRMRGGGGYRTNGNNNFDKLKYETVYPTAVGIRLDFICIKNSEKNNKKHIPSLTLHERYLYRKLQILGEVSGHTYVFFCFASAYG